MVGAGTALADRPSLTARDVRRPVTAPPAAGVLLDATGRVPAEGPLFDPELAPTLVVTTDAAPDAAQQAWLASGAKVLTVPPAAGGTGVDLLATLEMLAGLGVLQALFEGGAALSGSLVRQRASPTASSPTSPRPCSGATAVPRSTSTGPPASPMPHAGGWSTSPGSAPTSASTYEPPAWPNGKPPAWQNAEQV